MWRTDRTTLTFLHLKKLLGIKISALAVGPSGPVDIARTFSADTSEQKISKFAMRLSEAREEISFGEKRVTDLFQFVWRTPNLRGLRAQGIEQPRMTISAKQDMGIADPVELKHSRIGLAIDHTG
jgi:hypothetical protein